MESVATLAQWTVRAAGAFMVVVGAIIWTGNDGLVPAHVTVGVVFVLGLWVLALHGYRVRASGGLVATTVLWGFLLAALGVTQKQLLAGDVHWVVEVLHLAVGVIAIGLGEALASASTKARRRSYYR
jgi:hypothetical protein